MDGLGIKRLLSHNDRHRDRLYGRANRIRPLQQRSRRIRTHHAWRR